VNNYYLFFRKLILPLDLIDHAIPKAGKVLDLGCGQGQVATYLAQRPNRKVIGIDSNTNRLPPKSLTNLTFENGDITKISLQQIDGVVISDVLHHLSLERQQQLLLKISKHLNKNGVLVIKEIDTGELVRSKLSRLWDLLLYPQDKIAFTSTKFMKKILKELNFKVTVHRPCRFFPGSTTLYICTKYSN